MAKDKSILPPVYNPSWQTETGDIDLPPAYLNTPVPQLALELSSITTAPTTLQLSGHYTSPDFTLSTMRGHPVISVETDSYLISHEMELRNLISGSRIFTVKRSDTSGGNWMYRANEPGRSGKRLLEIETTPQLLQDRGQLTRLVFRNAMREDNQLDAVHLRFGTGKDNRSEVLYEENVIGQIQIIPSKRMKGPEFVLDIHFAGIDPLLFLVLALVIDDRGMSTRRRRRRAIGREALGIGKGPGAGLAGLYALGTL